jgi:hypothetical protein
MSKKEVWVIIETFKARRGSEEETARVHNIVLARRRS